MFGEFRTGKTQLSHTLCVTTQMPGDNGFSGGVVIYLGRSLCSARLFHPVTFILSDTENTFRPDRLRPIADRFNLDQEAVLDNVLYSRAYTSEQQITPVLKGNFKKSRKQRSGILNIVGDPSRFPKRPLSKSEN